MRYICTLIAVRDMEISKKFYRDVLGQKVVTDLGANVTLTGGFSLQTSESWGRFIDKTPDKIVFGNNDAELYFEEDDMDLFLKKLNEFQVEYVHPVKEHSWGQRVVRFYDPDRHIIEVGENMKMVAGRFMDEGMTIEETAKRMNVQVEYINNLLR